MTLGIMKPNIATFSTMIFNRMALRICKRPLVKDCSGAKVGGAHLNGAHV